jgi:hypothetical protein
VKPANESFIVFQWLGFNPTSENNTEYIGQCPFCHKPDKFYLSKDTLQWVCHAGHCQLSGNVYTYMAAWHRIHMTQTTDAHYQVLELDRGIPRRAFKYAALAYVQSKKQWIIPIYNQNGALVNMRLYRPGQKLVHLPTLDAGLYGHQLLAGSHLSGKVDLPAPTYIVEGEWDAIALQDLLWYGVPGMEVSPERCDPVLAVPGAGVFKDAWVSDLAGRNVYLCYDADEDGVKGREKAVGKLKNTASSVHSLLWPDDVPDKYDLRDFYRDCRTYVEFRSLFKLASEQAASAGSERENARAHARDTASAHWGGAKPAFSEVMQVYCKHLTVTEDYEMAIRTAYAVVLSKWVPGDPLWLYLVGPPSSGKTLILVSIAGSEHCILRSNLTPASLVSGFRMPDGSDPSLIPKLNDKVFVMKDFTEVLQMPPQTRDEIYSTLRGAYDGSVERPFGNGITRSYKDLHFTMLAGVTPSIFGQREASLGERFLMLHTVQSKEDHNDIILRALENVGKDDAIMDELQAVAGIYLNMPVDQTTFDAIGATFPDDFNQRISSLAQLISILRAEVKYDFKGEAMLYRPEAEIGARLAKQLRKLAISLCLLEEPMEYCDRVIRITTRVAFDTCVRLNLEIMQALAYCPGLTQRELFRATSIPSDTLQKLLRDLVALEAIRTSTDSTLGKTPEVTYYFSNHMNELWAMAGLYDNDYTPDTVTKLRNKKKGGDKT